MNDNGTGAVRRGRMRMVWAPAALLVASLVFAACGGGGGGEEADAWPEPTAEQRTFRHDDFAFTFEYPEPFRRGKITEVGVSLGGKPDAAEVLYLDHDNGIIVGRYLLTRTVAEEDVPRFVRRFDQMVSEMLGVRPRGAPLTVGGFPGASYDLLALPGLRSGQTRLIVLLDGDTQYFINCQSTPERRAAVTAACGQALATLQRTS